MTDQPPPPPSSNPPPPPDSGPPSTSSSTETEDTKPWFKKWWGIAVIVLGAVIIIAALTDDDEAGNDDEPTAEDTETVEVPDLVGMDLSDARDTLDEANLEVDETDADEDRTVMSPDNWMVESQDPEPGDSLEVGDTVTLTVFRPQDREDAAEEDEPDDDPEPDAGPEGEPEDETQDEPEGFADGTHRVGEDIEAGTYRSSGSSMCYWARLAGFGGELDDIIANGNNSPEIISIAEDDAGFETQGCGSWVDVEETYPDEPETGFEDGTYVVGEHIEPGEYSADGDAELCYWARLSDFGHAGVDGVITNGNTPTVIEISPEDEGFTTFGCGSWSQ